MSVIEWLNNNKDWLVVINSTRKIINDVQAIICFGSRVLLTANEESDYDLLVIVNQQRSLAEQRVINSLLKQTCQYKIHATLLTQKVFEAGMRMSPYIHMAYSTGIVVEGADLLTQHIRPLAKLGSLNELNNIRTEIDVYEEERKEDPEYDYRQSGSLLKALRSALGLKYLLTNTPTPIEMSETVKKVKGTANLQIAEMIKTFILELDDLISEIEENDSDRELEARICG